MRAGACQHVAIPALLLLAAALALADASIVTLALPPIIAELDASVQGAAAVLGAYTLVLAVALPLVARVGARPQVLGLVGGAVFAAASLGCGLAGSLGVLVALRALQAGGAAAVLVSAYAVLGGGRAWNAAAIFGFAVGPALGGVLTQLLDWRAIFLVQAPVAAAAAVAAWRARPVVDFVGYGPTKSTTPRETVGLALIAAALVGVLFLLVLLLVTGWSFDPLQAAAVVSILPVAALAASRLPAAPAAGALLIAGGVIALAFIPTASAAWTIAPQVMAGVGMGVALRTEDPRTLAARNAGITLALLLLAPVTAARIDDAVAGGREQGTALVLDARLPPLDKLELADALVGDLDPVDPRAQLGRSLDGARAKIGDEDLPAYDALAQRADDALVAGVQSAFAPAFAICGVLALIGALVLRPNSGVALVAGAAALVLAGGAYLAKERFEPDPVVIADPCEPRDLPSTGGIGGAIQDAALTALDRAACRYGSSREELALALVDDSARAAYEREHGVDPRDIGDLARAILGL